MITLSLITTDNPNKNGTSSEAYHGGDYNMRDFTLIVMHYNGRPFRIIQGTNMFHFSENNSTKIINPITRLIQSEQNIWITTSNKGTMQGTGENITLNSNVIITQKNNDKIRLTTEKINIDTINDIIHTNHPITITSPYWEIKSMGLHAVIGEKKINLTSQVKSRYYALKIH